MSKDEHQVAQQRRIVAILQYIRDHSDEALSLPQVAEQANHSRFHFVRLFQAQTGRGVGEHLRTFRLTRAAIQLQLSERKIVAIALEAGYANHESFSRAFRGYFGCSPRQFRQLKQTAATQEITMTQFRLKLVKIPVTDFARATQFYREVIGLKEQFAVAAYGWAQYELAEIPLCLYVPGMGGGSGQPGAELGFHLEVDNIEQFRAAYLAQGGQLAEDIVTSDDGGQFLMVQDPDGNSFKVVQAVN